MYEACTGDTGRTGLELVLELELDASVNPSHPTDYIGEES